MEKQGFGTEMDERLNSVLLKVRQLSKMTKELGRTNESMGAHIEEAIAFLERYTDEK